jgi:hypothetical protein
MTGRIESLWRLTICRGLQGCDLNTNIGRTGNHLLAKVVGLAGYLSAGKRGLLGRAGASVMVMRNPWLLRVLRFPGMARGTPAIYLFLGSATVKAQT